MDEFNTGGASWSSWFQGVASGVVDKAAQAAYVRPYDIAELEIKALGQQGYYTEGKAGTQPTATSGGITPTMLMLGGAALLAVFLLKD